MVTFQAPDDTRLDVEHFSIVAAYNEKKNKWKFTFLIKNAIPELIKEYIAGIEMMKTSVGDRILFINKEYDTFLLKAY